MLNTDEYMRHAKLCVRCSFCKYIDMNWIKSLRFSRQCPIDSKYAFNLYSPQGLLYAAIGEEENTIEFTPKLIDALYHCTLCGACDSRCKRNLDIEVLQVIEALRVRCAEKGHILPAHKSIAENIKKTGNEYGIEARKARSWLPDGIEPAKEAEMIYFVGCNAAYKQPDLATVMVEILAKTDTPFMILKDEKCEGNILFSTGQIELARELAEHNIKEIQNTGAKTVITSSAECYKSLKVDYPRLMKKSTEDMPYNVLHITEYIDQLLKDGKCRFNREINLKATYHDSCNLGRLSETWQEWTPEYEGAMAVGKEWRRGDKGIYDPPRNILSAIPGLELVEMERNRNNSWSIGTTGGVSIAFPEFALWAATERIEEAIATGSEAIITSSPDEKELLRKAIKNMNSSIKTYDITEIILDAL